MTHTIEELEKSHEIVEIKEVRANSFREGRDPQYLIDGSTETFFSMPNVGDKCSCIFDSPKLITHIAIAFRKGDKRQYGFRISSKDFLSNKRSEDFEVFDVEDFTGDNMEIISQGYHEGDLNGGSFSAYNIVAYTPKNIEQPKTDPHVKQFRTTIESKVDIDGPSPEPLTVESANSLEFDPNPDNSIGDDSKGFESTGRGRVLRHEFAEVCNITAMEFISNLPEGKQQLIRINSQDMQSLKPGETARYELDPQLTGKSVDIILNGNTVDDKNSIASVKYYGYPTRLLNEAKDKLRLKEEQKQEELKGNISQDD